MPILCIRKIKLDKQGTTQYSNALYFKIKANNCEVNVNFQKI